MTGAALLALAAWPMDAIADEADDAATVQAAETEAEAAEVAAYDAREDAREEARQRKIAKRRAKDELQRRMERGEIEGRVRNPVMIGFGPALIAAGVGGSIGFAIAASNVESGGGFLDFSGFERGLLIFGSVVSAGLGLGGGISLIVVGARKVPVDDAPPAAASHVPTVSVGAGTVTATWAF